MRLLNRLTDILSANLHELIEQYEDPELLLKQAVREMEDSIQDALGDAVKIVAHEKILARHLADEESAIGRCQQRAEAATARGDDQAAREALRDKRARQSVSAALAKQLEEASRAGQSLRRQIDVLRQRMEDANRKVMVLSARQRAAQARRRLLSEFSAAPIGDEAFDKFERMCRKVERTEAEAEAWAELASPTAATATFNDCQTEIDDADIETELRVLKARHQV